MQLLDTNIISELLRPRPNTGVLSWADQQDRFFISALSVEESMYGLTRNRNPMLLEAYKTLLLTRCDVIPITQDIACRAGTLRGQFSLHGTTRSQADMLIAATAQQHNITLVTRNTRDFEGCGISLLNPFTN